MVLRNIRALHVERDQVFDSCDTQIGQLYRILSNVRQKIRYWKLRGSPVNSDSVTKQTRSVPFPCANICLAVFLGGNNMDDCGFTRQACTWPFRPYL